jgi:hypothetical protein
VGSRAMLLDVYRDYREFIGLGHYVERESRK